MYWTNKLVDYIRLRKRLEDLLARAFDEATTELIDKINAEFGEEVTVKKEIIKNHDYAININDNEIYILITVDDLLEKGLSIDVNYETVLKIVRDIIIEQSVIY